MKHAEGNPEELKQKFWKALDASPFLMLMVEGQCHTASPMTAQLDKDANHAIWFFHQKNGKYAQGGPVVATFEAKGHDMFARFNGNLVVENDRALLDKFWNNFVEAWYDGGKDDPDLLFMRMDLGTAEIWDGDIGLLNVAKMALGMYVEDKAEERHVKETSL